MGPHEIFIVCMCTPSGPYLNHVSSGVCSYVLVQVPVHVYAEYCHKRVEKMTMMGAKKGLKKPSLDEIQHAKVSIICMFTHCVMCFCGQLL